VQFLKDLDEEVDIDILNGIDYGLGVGLFVFGALRGSGRRTATLGAALRPPKT